RQVWDSSSDHGLF
nr:immunoglobulin light chain junction region [Macaca mulatta]